MPIAIIVPRLGWSMEEGSFVAWLKRDGETVRPGDPLFSIEGDKAIQEVESLDGGILRIAPNAPDPGAPVRVGDVLGHLLTAAEAATTPAQAKAAQDAPKEIAPTPPRHPKRPAADVVPAAAQAAPAAAPAPGQGVRISPRALRTAVALGVDWTRITGTGRTGRIRESDIRTAAAGGAGPAPNAPAAPAGTVSDGRRGAEAVFFGELLLRLSTGGPTRFVQARQLEARYTGAEANAGVSLVNFGGTAAVVSAVPAHEVGQACVNFLRQYGLETAGVLRRGDRLGIYYLEPAAAPRPARVLYDRAGSAFAQLQPGDLDWDHLLAGARWLHWSGTAPAVGPGLPGVVAEACAAARRHGLTVSCDLNYRARLWSAAEARRVMVPLMAGVDVLLASEEQAGLVLGVEPEPGPAGGTDPARAERAGRLAGRLRARFGFRAVALTLRDGGGTEPGWWQCLLTTDEGTFTSRAYAVGTVDRIGAGDAFAGALIHQLLAGRPGAEAVEFAAAAGCLKHSIEGDFNLVSADEVRALVGGDTGRRVQR